MANNRALAATLFLAASIISATAQPIEPTADIPQECAKIWKNDFSMREYCITKHENARATARSRRIDFDIASLCTKQWPSDWSMFLYCVDKQTTAKERVEAREAALSIPSAKTSGSNVSSTAVTVGQPAQNSGELSPATFGLLTGIFIFTSIVLVYGVWTGGLRSLRRIRASKSEGVAPLSEPGDIPGLHFGAVATGGLGIEMPQAVGFTGVGSLFIGVFAPLVHFPIIGSINYVHQGRGDGIIVLILACVCSYLLLRKRYKWLWIPTLLIAGICTYTFIRVSTGFSGMQMELAKTLHSNPFRGLASAFLNSTSLGMGWLFLLIGILCLFVVLRLTRVRG